MAPTTACGTSAIRRWLPCLVIALFITTLAQQADADFTITNATIAQGDLWVAGQIDEPNTPITLDDSYTEKTDRNGRFEFRAAYHPATCDVVVKTDRQSRAVVIANCGQRGPAGPPGPPGNATPGYAPPQEPAPAGTSGGVMCGTQAALYQTESGSKVWITRKGRLAQEDPLRPLSSHAPGLGCKRTLRAGR